ncbi:unnamed protein product [Rotaria sordida]|uniref:Uncharacterized protein n=1 Tax=Rotaria sordida TaxID=392033 RepID=A0A815GYD9_9BILA|nr:unnamed protein product [Rotaria sordida]CAF1598653.1 unnamed protein product [Rotaria sordida]
MEGLPAAKVTIVKKNNQRSSYYSDFRDLSRNIHVTHVKRVESTASGVIKKTKLIGLNVVGPEASPQIFFPEKTRNRPEPTKSIVNGSRSETIRSTLYPLSHMHSIQTMTSLSHLDSFNLVTPSKTTISTITTTDTSTISTTDTSTISTTDTSTTSTTDTSTTSKYLCYY